MKRLLLALIRWYRRDVSPYREPCCRFIPTCSTYALEAVEVHGAVKGGLLALWLHQQYYMTHPRFITACIIGGVVVLVLAAVVALQLRKSDGKLGRFRVVPVESDYLMSFLTCAVTAVCMVLGLALGFVPAVLMDRAISASKAPEFSILKQLR